MRDGTGFAANLLGCGLDRDEDLFAVFFNDALAKPDFGRPEGGRGKKNQKKGIEPTDHWVFQSKV